MRSLDLTIPLSWSQRDLSQRAAKVNSVDLCVTTGKTKASGLSWGQLFSVPRGLKMEQKSSSFSRPAECKRAWFPDVHRQTFLCHSRHTVSHPDGSLMLRSQVVGITVHWVFAVTFQRSATWTKILFLYVIGHGVKWAWCGSEHHSTLNLTWNIWKKIIQ